MSPDLPPEAWAQIRYDYEHTDRPIEDICTEHGVSSGTLRDRRRRWRWARRRPPIPLEGPPPSPAPFVEAMTHAYAAPSPTEMDLSRMDASGFGAPGGTAVPALAAAPGASIVPDNRPIAARLQSAVDRVVPAIEAAVARLCAQGLPPRELERSARALASLTRTLRELNGLLDQHRTEDTEPPEDVEVIRARIAAKLEAIIASRADREAEAASKSLSDPEAY